MNDQNETRARLDDLEARAAHQERVIQDLSDMTAEQWEVIEALRRQVDRLSDRLQDLDGRIGAAPGDDRPPPHY